MAYATKADMLAEFDSGELILLTDPDNLAIVDATLDAALDRGSRTIDRYIGGRVSLPLASVPVDLVDFCTDLARYYLHDNGATDDVIRRYKEVISDLQLYAKGVINLGLDGNGDPTTPVDDQQVTIQSGGRVFDRADNGFI